MVNRGVTCFSSLTAVRKPMANKHEPARRAAFFLLLFALFGFMFYGLHSPKLTWKPI